ncbi:hypothetical protein ACTVCO_02185 [Sanguibacter sp. A247]|uniref:hypothetical protein n=1 Tax=unclassified Sanguibacter TaxID=2645534 RepID=UPI003FD81CBE
MSTLLRPTGSLPPRVYWRRRLAVLVVLVAVVALAIALVSKLGGDDAPEKKAPGTPGAAATAAETPTPQATGKGGVPICVPETLTSSLEANGSDFAADTEPAFTVTMTNTSTSPCLVDVSAKTRAVTVTSGPARVWNSSDCAKSPDKGKTLLIGAGKSEATTLTWNRTRSEAGCPRKGVVAKAGTYRATAEVLGVASKEIVFVLK